MTVRRAIMQDYPQIVRLLRQIAKLHQDGRPDITWDVPSKHDEAEVAAINASDSTPIFVAAEGDAVLGYIFCIVRETPARGVFRPYRTLYIDDLCVDEIARKKGVATQLMQAAKELAGELGCFNIELNVWEFNSSAIAFYEACGMKTQRRTMELEL